jgi:hypothetical protein
MKLIKQKTSGTLCLSALLEGKALGVAAREEGVVLAFGDPGDEEGDKEGGEEGLRRGKGVSQRPETQASELRSEF